jgi:hypothetical protein
MSGCCAAGVLQTLPEEVAKKQKPAKEDAHKASSKKGVGRVQQGGIEKGQKKAKGKPGR